MATRARRKPKKRVREVLTLEVPPAGQRVWVLDMPFRMGHPKVRWYPDPGVHAFVGVQLPPELVPFASMKYTRLRRIEDSYNRTPGPRLESVRWTLRPIQKEMAAELVASLRAWNHAVLSADTGVGKTLAAIAAARVFLADRPAAKVLVVVDRPAAITMRSWAAAIAGVGDGGLDWVVSSPDQLKRLLGPRGGIRESFDLVIADETQNFRHPSERTQLLKKVAEFRTGPVPILSVTATLGHNPSEYLLLAPLIAAVRGERLSQWSDVGRRLIALGHPLVPNQFSPGDYRWSDAAREDATLQQRSTGEVQRWLASARPSAIVHRAAPWGAPHVRAIGVDLDAAQLAEYQQEWREFRLANDIARTRGDGQGGRAALIRFRQKASFLRVGHTVGLALSQVQKGRQVVISVEHVTTGADPIAEAIEAAGVACSRIYGDHDAAEERLAFQLGVKPVCVVSKTSAISLHANEELPDGRRASSTPRVGLMHQPRYSGIAAQQVIGRTHRDGQTSPWFLLFARGTIEQEAAQIMVEHALNATASAGASTRVWSRVAGLFGIQWISDNDDEL
ncbi:DEAD/DEAH box helicase family protein [Gordonia aichiensis]|uniref:DEAD/DEAH box helicase family protein n=1 Tax=Gordonia aichiensis TaxID=36820 RepID=UPI003267C14D